MLRSWRPAMAEALYGPGGFFVTGAPAGHFRTSVHATPAFAGALLRLLHRVDAALDQPARLDLVDVGAGRAELLRTLAHLAPPELAARLRLVAVELAPRPADLPPTIHWVDAVPDGLTGLLLGTEWLDNVPVDVAEMVAGGWRQVLVAPDGAEQAGPPVTGADVDWLARWWPVAGGPGGSHAGRAEIGRFRDTAWAAAVAALDTGLALAVDYGHLRDGRPVDGTLTGYRGGRQVPPVPDGSTDLTAHVAVDAVAVAGAEVAGQPYTLISQAGALRALGVDGARPPLALAGTDPAGYVRALAAASAAAELTDPAGLGGHWWLLQPVGIEATLMAPGIGPAPRMAR
ncbi:SAM-dependent methyltransferase [Micromonospora sp. CPCC 206060]|uniref:SAM-dependent methyltransferase n=1 Tax=Micromonospora sp. CPCC 206060 TaxID=3122406 RepID=UPI002FF376BF